MAQGLRDLLGDAPVVVSGWAPGLRIPAVVLEIKETEDAVRGDTVSAVQKPATLTTGLVIKVPAHIKVGELLEYRGGTRNGYDWLFVGHN